jgi:hypothetical protein
MLTPNHIVRNDLMAALEGVMELKCECCFIDFLGGFMSTYVRFLNSKRRKHIINFYEHELAVL